MKTKIINNVEYELKTHDKGKILSQIKIPKGWRLLKPSEAMMLWELKPFEDWFFVEQIIKRCKDKYVAWFVAYSVRARLYCDGFPSNSDASLGVRFCRDIKKVKK
jgi:hypothetical protein